MKRRGSKAEEVMNLIEVLSGSKLNEAYFAYTLLSRYIDYDNLTDSYSLLDGTWVRVGKEIDMKEDMEDVGLREFEKIVKKFFSKGVKLPGPDYGIPEPWPNCVTWLEEEEIRVGVDKWESTGDYIEFYQELEYLLKGKGKYLGDYRLKLDKVWIEVDRVTEPEEYTSSVMRRLSRPLELGPEE